MFGWGKKKEPEIQRINVGKAVIRIYTKGLHGDVYNIPIEGYLYKFWYSLSRAPIWRPKPVESVFEEFIKESIVFCKVRDGKYLPIDLIYSIELVGREDFFLERKVYRD